MSDKTEEIRREVDARKNQIDTKAKVYLDSLRDTYGLNSLVARVIDGLAIVIGGMCLVGAIFFEASLPLRLLAGGIGLLALLGGLFGFIFSGVEPA